MCTDSHNSQGFSSFVWDTRFLMRRLFLAGCILPFPFLHQTFRLGSVLSQGSQPGFRDSRSSGKDQQGQGGYRKWGRRVLVAMRAQSRMQEGFLEEVLSCETRKQIN